MSAVAAQSIGVAALMKQVGTLATVQSFNDCFYLATLVSLCGLVPCLWLKRGKKAAGGGHGEAMILE
jgi:hypothetical protein